MPDECNRLLNALQERQLGQPVLLFAAGHRPLAFVLGQCLHGLAPLAEIVGWDGCSAWATLLSHPDGAAFLEESLHDRIE